MCTDVSNLFRNALKIRWIDIGQWRVRWQICVKANIVKMLTVESSGEYVGVNGKIISIWRGKSCKKRDMGIWGQ